MVVFSSRKELLKPQQTRRQGLRPARGARGLDLGGLVALPHPSVSTEPQQWHRVPEEGLSLCPSPSVSQNQASVAGIQAAVGHGWVTWVC